MERFYGAKVGPVEEVALAKLTVHPWNIRAEKRRESDYTMLEEIREEGVHEPLLITPTYEILRGSRRYALSLKAGKKTVPARFTEPNLPERTLMKLIYRDNVLRESLTEEDICAIIVQRFGKQRVLDMLPRGLSTPDAKSRIRPLHSEINELMGLSVSRAKEVLSTLRRRLKLESVRKRLAGMSSKDQKEARYWLDKYDTIEARIEAKKKQYHTRLQRELRPLTQELKDIAKSLKAYGGKKLVREEVR